MENREHDLFMEMLDNPEGSLNTMILAGLTPTNTYIEDKSKYKQDEWVQDQFKDKEGNFDENAFNQAYTQSKMYYNDLANITYDEAVKNQLSFHRNNIWAPQELKRQGPEFKEVKMSNPYEQVFNLTQLGRVDSPSKSIDELAQSHKVLLNPTTAGKNLENAQWGDSPNDNFWGNFFDTLVLAQYDEDGTHTDPFTGETVKHNKGDYKLNNDGEFYYEKLDGRDVYGKQVLNKMNVLTTDGSYWNKFDFFDSDDVEQKSVGGTILKNAALVGTMFIPYVGPWIAGLSIATQLAGLGATLGKMLTGSENSTLSAIEGWSKSLDRQTAKTQYAQENTWCWENFIGLIGDVMGQLQEQRFIFNKLPQAVMGGNMMTKEGQAAKLAEFTKKQKELADIKIKELRNNPISLARFEKEFKNIQSSITPLAQADLDSFIKGYNKLGEVFSKGYMTAITVGDTYEEAKQAGATDLDATLLTLGYAAAEYKLLSTGLGEWILPELRANKYKMQAIAKALTSLDKETTSLRQQFGQAVKNFPKEGKKEYAKKLFNIGKNIANAEYTNGTRTTVASLAAGAGEGFEEVSEELLADFSKGCYDTVKWLQGDDTRINAFGYDFKQNKWNANEVLDRYGMSLIGGFVGGGLTNLATNYREVNQAGNMDSRKAVNELVYMTRNGQIDNFMKQVNKMQLGNPNLSATEYDEVDGNVIFSPGTKENNQDLYAKRAIQKQVDLIQNILQANGANISDGSFLEIQTLKDLRFNALQQSTTAGAYINEFNNLTSKLVGLTNKLDLSLKSAKDTDNNGTVTDKENRESKENKETNTNQQTADEIREEIKGIKQQLDDLLSGKRSYEFISQALFEMTTDLSKYFTTPTFPLFAEKYKKKKFSELTDNEKETTRQVYEQWKATEGRDTIKTMSDIFRKVSEQASKTIISQGDKYVQNRQALQQLQNALNPIFKVLNAYNLKEEDQLEQAKKYTSIESQIEIQNLIANLGTEEEQKQLEEIKNKPIDPNLSGEERSKAIKDKNNEIFTKSVEIASNSIETYLQPIFNTGFINRETKNQLLNTLQIFQGYVQHQLNTIIQQLENPEDLSQIPELENQLEEPQNRLLELQSLYKQVEDLNQTPFEENFNQFSIAVGKEPINISQLIDKLNLAFNDVSNNLPRFNLDQDLQVELNNAIYTLEMYKAAILAARTDEARAGDIFGYNATLNEVSKKVEGDFPELAEIDTNTANVLIEDININLEKLQFLQRLNKINQGQKLSKQDRIADKKDILIYNRLKSIVTIPDNDEIKNWNGFLELQNAINSMQIHSSLSQKDSIDVSESQREDFYKEKLSAENAIYKFFQDNIDKVKDVNQLAKFLSPSRLGLYTEAKELLNENMESLDDNSVLWWLASRAALSATDFYGEYKQIIDPTAEKPLAPIPTQEVAVYNAYASILNGDIITHFFNASRKAMIDDWNRTDDNRIEYRKQILKSLGFGTEAIDRYSQDSYAKYCINFLPIPRYSNVTLVEGIPGAGKSQAVFKQIVTLLNKFHPELLQNVVVAHGADTDQDEDIKNKTTNAEKLKNDIGLKEATHYGREELMRSVNSNWKEYLINPETGKYVVPLSDYTLTDENEIVSSLSTNPVSSSEKVPTLIIIDEISKFSEYDVDQINRYAKERGITVIAAGDFDQDGVIGSHPVKLNNENQAWNLGLNRTNFVRSPKLGVSMRTDNSLKTGNLQKLQTYMQHPTNQSIEFEYYEDETGLYGDRVFNYVIEDVDVSQNYVNLGKRNEVQRILAQVDKLIETLKPNEKIGYIFTDKTSPIYTELISDKYKNYIDFKKGGSAQGLEGRYYIIESSPNSALNSNDEGIKHNAVEAYLKNIYTGVSRAQQGSILIVPMDTGPTFKEKQVSSKITENVGKNVIVSYTKKYKDLLDKVVTDGKKIEYVKRTSNSKFSTVSPKVTSDGLEDGISSTPKQDTDEYKQEKETLLEAINKANNVDKINQLVSKSYEKFPDIQNDADVLNSTRNRLEEIQENISNFINKINECEDIAELDKLELDFQDDIILTYDEVKNAIAIKREELDPENPNNPPIKQEVKAQEIPELDTKKASEPLPYEDNLVPITNTDIVSENEYKEQLDKSSESTDIPKSEVQSNQGKPISIEMLLHSFNTHERGIRLDSNRQPVIDDFKRLKARIDSFNGLLKVDQILGKLSKDANEQTVLQHIKNQFNNYDEKIGALRSLLFNIKDKAELCEAIEKQLGLKNIYITFALKSHNYDRNSDQEFIETSINPFNKGKNEVPEYNGSKDEKSNTWHPKQLVAIIGTNTDDNILELPLLALSSPFTIMQAQSQDGDYPFQEVYNEYTRLLESGMPIHKISLSLQDKFSGNTNYQHLMNLFKLYDFTERSIYYIKDNQWTPSKDLRSYGSQFVTNRGFYQGVPGLEFNTEQEASWTAIQEFAQNPNYTITSKILVCLEDEVSINNQKTMKVAKKGHPFILVASDRQDRKGLRTDKDIVNRFIEEQNDPTLEKKVQLIYILPPKASIKEYAENLKRIIHKEDGVKNIGQLFTSYKLLKVLFTDQTFVNNLEDRLPGSVSKVQEALQKLDDPNLTMVDRKDILYTTFNWSDIGLQGKAQIKLAGLFDGILTSYIYDINTISGNQNTFTLNQNNLQHVEAILSQSGINGIYYNVKVSRKDPQMIGPFAIPIQGNNYTIGGKYCQIHGKLDSWVFSGDMNWLIEGFLNDLRPSQNGHRATKDSYSYMNYKSKLGQPSISKEQMQKNNIVSYIKQKTGLDLKDLYENNTIEEANKKAIESINGTGQLAFSINELLKISNTNDILKGNISIQDNSGNIITDLSNLSDNNGKYTFNLYVDNVHYTAEFDGTQLNLTPDPVEQQPVDFSVNYDTFDDYINNFNAVLENYNTEMDYDYQDLKDSTSYEEFIQILSNANSFEEIVSDRINSFKEILNNIKDPEQKKLLEELIRYEESRNEDEGTCQYTNIIKF